MADPTVFPSIHLNGTGRKTLSEGYGNAYRKLIEFREAFANIEHNGRDYYPQGSDAYSRSRKERDAQLDHIAQLMRYLEAHLIHLGE